MPATGETLRVEGLRELQRAFKQADKALARELRVDLKKAGEPVAIAAESLAERNISHLGASFARGGLANVGAPWGQMRVGVSPNSVYVAPKQRGTRNASKRRPNLAGLLLGKAMVPALEQNQGAVVRRIDEMLDSVGRAWEIG